LKQAAKSDEDLEEKAGHFEQRNLERIVIYTAGNLDPSTIPVSPVMKVLPSSKWE
jgi:hypothetical protein